MSKKLIYLVIILFVIALFKIATLNSLYNTEMRATENMENFIKKNEIKNITRKGCAGDTDGNGMASCMVVTEKEKISLECPSEFFSVNLFGASGCKENLNQLSLSNRLRK